MFRPSDMVIDAFVGFALESHAAAFPAADPSHARAMERALRMALPRIATGTSLYHNLDHTITVVQVGQDLLRGRIIRDGDISSEDWVHVVSGLACLFVGFCQGAVRGDNGQCRVVDTLGATITLARGVSDGGLWVHYVERSKLFVRERFSTDPVLSAGRLVELIEAARFPPLGDDLHSDGSCSIMLSSHLIGGLASPRFRKKLTPLWVEMGESELREGFGFATRADFTAGYVEWFWKRFEPFIPDGMELLTHTGAGREWLANLRAHVLREEHSLAER